MYFYISKTGKYENEQAQLLEVRCDACLDNGDGKGADGIIINKLLY